MGRFCLHCPKRKTCTEMCPELKKYLGHKFRAHNSPKAKLVADFGAFEHAMMDKTQPRKTRIRGLW